MTELRAFGPLRDGIPTDDLISQRGCLFSVAVNCVCRSDHAALGRAEQGQGVGFCGLFVLGVPCPAFAPAGRVGWACWHLLYGVCPCTSRTHLLYVVRPGT